MREIEKQKFWRQKQKQNQKKKQHDTTDSTGRGTKLAALHLARVAVHTHTRWACTHEGGVPSVALSSTHLVAVPAAADADA